jgi:hypothetical protein
MDKAIYLQEIIENVSMFDVEKLKEISNYINYLKYKDYIDPTLEILSNEEWFEKTQKGISEIDSGDVVAWESMR